MTEWHKNFRKEIEYCTYCPKLCRFSCPVAQVECSETVTPTSKMTILKLVRDGVLPFDGEAAELMYLCTGCLVSRTYCEHEIEVYPPYEAFRIEAVKKGVAPEKAVKLAETWDKRGNPFGEDMAKIVNKFVPEKYRGTSAKVVLFPGCSTLHYFPEQIKDAADVLAAIGVDFNVFTDDKICCGQPLLTLGHQEQFEKQARRIAKALAHADLVISPCPTCTHFIKDRYQDFGISVKAEVKHITEFVAENLDKIPIGKKESRPAVYHDPCHLGRYLGVYNEPRAILEAVLDSPPIEFFESRERATCCGGGGGLPVIRPGTARDIAREKAAAIKDLKAELLATACPMCRRMLGRAGRDQGVVTDDVVSILARCIKNG